MGSVAHNSKEKMLASRVRPAATQFSKFIVPLRARYATEATNSYEYIKVSTPRAGVGLIELHRPKALNALFSPLMHELNTALKAFDAGADIKEMSTKDFADAYGEDFIESWSELPNTIKKPVISAVNGHASGGGCELAMMCDILYCHEKANFGQPEIKLGVIPGAGGSQRLTRAIGKSKAMDIILTGRNFSGRDAFDWGLAAKVFETPEQTVDGALETAETIASYSRLAVKAGKEVVNKSQDQGIREGVEYERRVFHSLFGSEDQKIGMQAFAEKKKPEWKHR